MTSSSPSADVKFKSSEKGLYFGLRFLGSGLLIYGCMMVIAVAILFCDGLSLGIDIGDPRLICAAVR